MRREAANARCSAILIASPARHFAISSSVERSDNPGSLACYCASVAPILMLGSDRVEANGQVQPPPPLGLISLLSRLLCIRGRFDCFQRVWPIAAHTLAAHLVDGAYDRRALHAAARISARRARGAAFAAIASAPIIAVGIAGAGHRRSLALHRREFPLACNHTLQGRIEQSQR
jgi:hypothetical protein